MADALRNLPLPAFESATWTPAPPLPDGRVAIVSTAGLHRRGDATFAGGASDYRIIPADLDAADLLMSHVSTNFDRSGFQQDTEVIEAPAVAAEEGAWTCALPLPPLPEATTPAEAYTLLRP